MSNNLVNNIEAEIRNKNQMKAESVQSTALSRLVSNMEASNNNNAKLVSSITLLNKNLSNFVKKTSNGYSSGFDKSLHTLQNNKTGNGTQNNINIALTNKLLKQLVDKKTDKQNILMNTKDKAGFNLAGLIPLIPLLAGAVVPFAIAEIMKGLSNKAPSWLKTLLNLGNDGRKIGDENGAKVSSGGIGASVALNTGKTLLAIKRTSDLFTKLGDKFLDPEKALAKAVKLEKGGAKAAADALVDKTIKKVAEKSAREAALHVAEKSVLKSGAKTLGKIGAKAIPAVGAGIEGYSAIQSARAGNYLGAGLHGVAAGANLTGAFSWASLPIGVAGDISDIAYNMAESKKSKERKAKSTAYITPADNEVDIKNLQPDFRNRFEKMIGEFGKDVKVNSAFRSYEKQKYLFDNKKPGELVAKPGTSRHEQGMAIDLDSAQVNELRDKGLLQKYGFTQKYPGSDPQHIQALARGGITNGPTNALIGEAGKEAVIPLESDEGIAALAQAMNKYNKGDVSAIILNKILSVLSGSNPLAILSEINNNIKNSETNVSMVGNNYSGATA
jgi:hypothetical protein